MDSDKPNSKTGLTRSQELDIVIQAIKAYAIRYKLDPAEISDLFAECCDEFVLPQFKCPLCTIEAGVSMLKQGKGKLRTKPIDNHTNRLKYLNTLKKGMLIQLKDLPSSKIDDIDKLLDRINEVNLEIVQLESL